MAPQAGGIGPLVCACTVIPFIVLFYMWAFEGMDPENCWVTEGQLWVSQSATGAANETNVAEKWRTFWTWAFWLHLIMVILMCLTGAFSCAGDKTAAIAHACGGLGCCTVLAKWGFWVWALILRFSDEGSVAAGQMVAECENANPGMAAGTEWINNVQDAFTQDDETRLLQSSEETSAFMSGASCNDPGAFQSSGGILFFAWIIISAVKCI